MTEQMINEKKYIQFTALPELLMELEPDSIQPGEILWLSHGRIPLVTKGKWVSGEPSHIIILPGPALVADLPHEFNSRDLNNLILRQLQAAGIETADCSLLQQNEEGKWQSWTLIDSARGKSTGIRNMSQFN